MIHWIDIEHKFVIGEPAPTPIPPGPTPTPTPTPTPGGFGDVLAVVLKYADAVRDDQKADSAKLIAKAYREHAALARKGDYANADVLADATSSQFLFDLSMSRYLRWRPMMSRLRDHMTELLAAKKRNNMADWAALWEEYAKGFDAVATKGKTNASAK